MTTISSIEILDQIPAPRRAEDATVSVSHHLYDVNLRIFASVSDAARRIVDAATSRSTGTAVFTCNVDHLMLMKSDLAFRDAYARAEVATIDGAPLALISRWTGTRNARRVTGVDLAGALMDVAEFRGLRVALIGGAPGNAEEAARRLRRTHTDLEPVLTDSPRMGFRIGDDEDDRLVRKLQEFRPDIVIVCLGAPRQELWIDAHKRDLPGAVLVGAGATIDFLAGTQARAPRWCQKSGTEAAWRLATDFRRLWRRYLARDLRFIYSASLVLASHRMLRIRGRYLTTSHPVSDISSDGCAACTGEERLAPA